MRHLKEFNNINENNGLSYCKSCSFLLYPDDNTLCKYCLVLGILGISKNDDGDNIYGQLKYMIKFNKEEKLIEYLNNIKKEYNLTDDQYNKIINIL